MNNDNDTNRETDRGMWAISCLIASILLGGLVLAVNYCRGNTPWI